MTAEKILEVAAKYEKLLLKKGITPRRLHLRVIAPPEQSLLRHAAWMVAETRSILTEDEGRIGKAFRWLGFVQGILLSTGVFCIEDLKDHNRP